MGLHICGPIDGAHYMGLHIWGSICGSDTFFMSIVLTRRPTLIRRADCTTLKAAQDSELRNVAELACYRQRAEKRRHACLPERESELRSAVDLACGA